MAIASAILVSPFLTVSPVSAETGSVSVDNDDVTVSDSPNPPTLTPNGVNTSSGDQELSASSGDDDPNDAEDNKSARPSEDYDSTDAVIEALEEELADALDPDTAESLLDEVTSDGMVRVIVSLAVDTEVEAELTGREVLQQRRDIADAAEDLFDDLNDKDVEVVHQLSVVPVVVLEVTPEGLLDLIASDAVESVAVDEVLERTIVSHALATLSNQPGDHPLMSQSLTGQNISPLHLEGVLGQGGSIAVLDDGVDKYHPFFVQFDGDGNVQVDANGNSVSRVIAEACFSTRTAGTRSFCPVVNGQPRLTSQTNPNDVDSALPCSATGCPHGTHVAGIAAGGPSINLSGQTVRDTSNQPFTGVAPKAGIVAVQVFHEQVGGGSSGVAAFASDILAGLEWVYRHRNTHNTRVVNMSLGGGRHVRQCSSADTAMTGIIQNLLAVGIPTVIASGNNGWSDSISFPACIPEAWAVGSTRGDANQVSSFTNTHPTMVNLYAVGSEVYSSVPNGGYAFADGTSMAAPQVAGAVALLRNTYPTATPRQLLTALQCTGTGVTVRENGTSVGFSRPRINVADAHFSPCPTARPTVTRGNTQATVSISQAPASLTRITQYEASCEAPGQPTSAARGSSTTLTVRSLVNGVAYNCSMRAMSGWGSETTSPFLRTTTSPEGWSTWSSSRAITPATIPTRPSQPTVTRGNTTARVTVPTPANNGAAIIQYQARCTASGQTTRSATSSSRAVTVSNLRNNVRYSCQTRARNDVGWSSWSTARTISAVARPSRPARPSVASLNQAARVSVSTPAANGAAITRFQARCQARGQTTRTATSTTRTVTVSSLRNGVTYSCQIRAQNAIGWSDWSTTRNVRPAR